MRFEQTYIIPLQFVVSVFKYFYFQLKNKEYPIGILYISVMIYVLAIDIYYISQGWALKSKVNLKC